MEFKNIEWEYDFDDQVTDDEKELVETVIYEPSIYVGMEKDRVVAGVLYNVFEDVNVTCDITDLARDYIESYIGGIDQICGQKDFDIAVSIRNKFLEAAKIMDGYIEKGFIPETEED